jgi:hypothetical protein
MLAVPNCILLPYSISSVRALGPQCCYQRSTYATRACSVLFHNWASVRCASAVCSSLQSHGIVTASHISAGKIDNRYRYDITDTRTDIEISLIRVLHRYRSTQNPNIGFSTALPSGSRVRGHGRLEERIECHVPVSNKLNCLKHWVQSTTSNRSTVSNY